MPDPGDYRMDFRPASYWDVPESTFANIKGDIRKRLVLAAAEGVVLETLSPEERQDTLPEEDRRVAGRMHPWYMGLCDSQRRDVESR